jgi:hypothetical protein
MSVAYTKLCWRKKEIYNHLQGWNRKLVTQVMNRIIAEKREISIFQAKDEKSVRPSEAEMIFKEFS